MFWYFIKNQIKKIINHSTSSLFIHIFVSEKVLGNKYKML